MKHVLVSVGQRLLVGVLVTAGIAALTSSHTVRSDLADNIRLAKNGDTHITQYGLVTTIDCGDSTVFVNGSQNVITALGSCYAISVRPPAEGLPDDVIEELEHRGIDWRGEGR